MQLMQRVSAALRAMPPTRFAWEDLVHDPGAAMVIAAPFGARARFLFRHARVAARQLLLAGR